MDYLNDKNEIKDLAINHTSEMKRIYKSEIKTSSDNTHIYDDSSFLIKNYNNGQNVPTEVLVVLEDSVSAAVNENEHIGKTAILNFSSYKEPGGLFLAGSKAQEECLCHASFLYNVLRKFDDTFYKENRKDLNKALYRNKALYSPDIIFFDKDNKEHRCDVITCASPNKRAAQQYCKVSDEKNCETLSERIDFVYKVASIENVDTLILGSYGCGVFGQDIDEVAELFIYHLKKYNFKKVIFAVINPAHKEIFEEAIYRFE